MIYIDSGAWLARYLPRDQYHQQAVRGFDRLRQHGAFTSIHVVDETVTWLARRAGGVFAAARGRELLASRVVEVLRPSVSDELLALDELHRFADQGVSYTDCLSFVLMRRHGLKDAFAFDRHFVLAGFRLWP